MQEGKRLVALVAGLVLVFSFILPAWARAGEEKRWTREHEVALEAGLPGAGQVPVQDQEREREREREQLKLQDGKSVAEHVYKGVENALMHVKNPVARAALTAILEGKSVAEAVYEARAQLSSWQDADEIASVTEQLESAVEADTTLDAGTRTQLKKHLGVMYLKAGKFKNARELLETVLEQEPGDEEAYRQLDQAYAASGDLQVKVFVKGKALQFDVPPRMENDRVLIPVRFLAENLGATVNYDNGEVIIKNQGSTIRLVIGSNKALVDGVTVDLDVPAQVVDGRTLVPLRFVSEKFKAKVDYFGGSNLVAVQPL
ncbi:hypothetical protein MGLY_21310 [Neomoorella glycerini]|uniref:Copper amine oxidase-like N-terminal domain-containing protein n=1 Tax=Neomoorella glycerini TaxID=55779 RepID=A0A6I5ZTN5_9FIRM|nr:stalk domain-containing protein [Moorella glycerini]QGP92741.1 hypothetical protein MGLY_21310 [Moorella glycerini]